MVAMSSIVDSKGVADPLLLGVVGFHQYTLGFNVEGVVWDVRETTHVSAAVVGHWHLQAMVVPDIS